MSTLALLADGVRLAAVPILGLAALQDVRTRRVDNRRWVQVGALAVVALLVDVVDGALGGGLPHNLLVGLGLATGLWVVSYATWRFVAGFGGADAKGLMAVALLFPTTPRYVVGRQLPLISLGEATFIGVVLINVFFLAGVIGAGSYIAGRRELPLMPALAGGVVVSITAGPLLLFPFLAVVGPSA